MTASAGLLAWALAVSVWDIRCRRIPNLWLLAALAPGVAMFLFGDQGWLGQSLTASVLGSSIAFLLLFPGFVLKAMGGGDVKFATCCGWFVGPLHSLYMVLAAAVALGVLSAVVLWRSRSHASPHRVRVPAGPAIAAGFALAVVLVQAR
ncbi:prepilin peptidase CpaA [Panacagrimonas perspica]|uniref:Prepilin peptidase CpaA n=1 Tax=Panacagrimonas perspica TaxID=381431 RepID=A0A4R7NT40_9GAMM|nr:A24 family peptidase [Panacagrimonas perspica]TDU24244.1 prepilin peptidase CpaA [Panacagrimonas perspica]THD04649.1 hypothetical protein B1810_04340 [Panacagrimonas perspica]